MKLSFIKKEYDIRLVASLIGGQPWIPVLILKIYYSMKNYISTWCTIPQIVYGSDVR